MSDLIEQFDAILAKAAADTAAFFRRADANIEQIRSAPPPKLPPEYETVMQYINEDHAGCVARHGFELAKIAREITGRGCPCGECKSIYRSRDRVEQRDRRRRAVAAAPWAPFTEAQVRQRWSMFGNRCWVNPAHPAEATDHVKPLAKGGANMLANFRPICTSCNSSKGAKWPYTPPPA